MRYLELSWWLKTLKDLGFLLLSKHIENCALLMGYILIVRKEVYIIICALSLQHPVECLKFSQRFTGCDWKCQEFFFCLHVAHNSQFFFLYWHISWSHLLFGWWIQKQQKGLMSGDGGFQLTRSESDQVMQLPPPHAGVGSHRRGCDNPVLLFTLSFLSFFFFNLY